MNWTLHRTLVFIIIALTGPLAQAEDNSVDGPFYTNLSEKKIACTIGKAMKASLKAEGKTWAQKKKEMINRLDELRPIGKVYVGGNGLGLQQLANKTIIDYAGYMVQDAFIDLNLEKKLPDKNWLQAYHYLTEVSRVRKKFLEEKYNLVEDPDVFKKVEAQFAKRQLYSESTYIIPFTKEDNEKSDRLAGRAPNKFAGESTVRVYNFDEIHSESDRKLAFAHVQAINLISSPMFKWLAEQPKESVDHIAAFEKATDLYGDPFTAAGVIAWISALECSHANRDRHKIALASSRLKPVLFRVSDHAGTVYHFWGYLVRALLGEPDGAVWLRTRSRIFEGLIQKDGQDVTTDMFGIRVGTKVAEFLESESEECNAANSLPKKDAAVESDTVKKAMPRSTAEQDSTETLSTKNK